MVTAVTLALALSFEPMEKNVMEKPPRGADEGLLGKLFIWRIIFVSVVIGTFTILIFDYLKSNGADEALARTVAVNTLVAGQLFYLFNCRHIQSTAFNRDFFNNPYAFLAAGTLTVLQLLFVYVPAMNTFFDTRALAPEYWLYSGIPGLAVFLIVEVEKAIMRKLEKPVN
jgi:magnesium-transporting ATPase (P-type)